MDGRATHVAQGRAGRVSHRERWWGGQPTRERRPSGGHRTRRAGTPGRSSARLLFVVQPAACRLPTCLASGLCSQRMAGSSHSSSRRRPAAMASPSTHCWHAARSCVFPQRQTRRASSSASIAPLVSLLQASLSVRRCRLTMLKTAGLPAESPNGGLRFVAERTYPGLDVKIHLGVAHGDIMATLAPQTQVELCCLATLRKQCSSQG